MLSGETLEAQRQAKIADVRSQISERVRMRKGLSSKPEQFDAEVISQLPDVAVIDHGSSITERPQPSTKIYNEGHLPLPEFATRLRLRRANQLKNPPKEKAA